MQEIVINEKNKKRLHDLNTQVQQLSAYMRVIGDTILANADIEGEYLFSPDFSKLIKKEAANGGSVPR